MLRPRRLHAPLALLLDRTRGPFVWRYLLLWPYALALLLQRRLGLDVLQWLLHALALLIGPRLRLVVDPVHDTLQRVVVQVVKSHLHRMQRIANTMYLENKVHSTEAASESSLLKVCFRQAPLIASARSVATLDES